MDALAVVMQQPGDVALDRLPLSPLDENEVVVDVRFSGISTGTERLLWAGEMPSFPGMGYPLVPGYETVGRISAVAAGLESRIGEWVFVSGARCYGEVNGLFGGAASRMIVPSEKATKIPDGLKADGVLLALAATALHALNRMPGGHPPELIIGHGVLGRLLARLTLACGHAAPMVWETHEIRRGGAQGYQVIAPTEDRRHDYQYVCDVSGNIAAIDQAIARTAKDAAIVLAGFYKDRVSFDFPPAFMREITMTIAAEWAPGDLAAVVELTRSGQISLDGLITHIQKPRDAATAYETAFNDPACLKMILDWSEAK
ncbi:MAG: chlorophyll synthesis pathway protein BchC [Pseudomonadota bacterium]